MSRDVVQATANYVRLQFERDCTGHDWWHVERVWRLSRYIAENEVHANALVVELAALLHDLTSLHTGEETENSIARIKRWLTQQSLSSNDIQHVCRITEELTYHGAANSSAMTSVEGKIVQDAERLDAMGAIGIARTFAYGGQKGMLIHDPALEPTITDSLVRYKGKDATTINHFYERLLLLKDSMHTHTGKKLAQMRHQLMESFLRQFLVEWELFKDA